MKTIIEEGGCIATIKVVAIVFIIRDDSLGVGCPYGYECTTFLSTTERFTVLMVLYPVWKKSLGLYEDGFFITSPQLI